MTKKKFVNCKYTLKTSEIIITDTILNNNIKTVINKNKPNINQTIKTIQDI
jgi:hypothetical protein